ncbi:MAG: SpoIIE family protein phosphatase [Desulfococcaceae bacterium]
MINLFDPLPQYFYEPPDREFFRRQAAQYGFDEDAYMKALKKVPIFSDDYVKKIINFLTGLTGMIGKMGLVSKRQSEFDRIQTEMQVAKKIQTCLLPKKAELSGYEIAASCEPSEEVGGDYYDVISVGGYDWIVIGDVSGHGVSAGLVMMMVQTAIHTVLIQNPQMPVSRLLSVINRTIYENIVLMDEQKHMTIIVIACGKDGFFDFSGLHEDILFWCAETRKVESIETDGMWIGLEADISEMLPVSEFRLGTGDCLILYTDGIIEARGKDGKFFGTERLTAVIEASGGKSASEIHAAILNEISDFEKTDDVTLFVMKRV